MQIKTALAIGTGIAIGAIFGMSVSEDTKCKTLGKVRKTLIRALGGEEKKYNRPCGATSYVKYYANKKSNSETKTDNNIESDPIKYEDLLTFDDRTLANDFLNIIKNFVNTCNGPMSVFDLYRIRNKCIDYTWDAYGWDKETVLSSQIESTCYGIDGNGVCTKWAHKINIGKPKLLKEE